MLPRHCVVCVVTLALLSGLWEDVTPYLTLPRHCLVCVVTLQLLSCLWDDVTLSLSGLCGDVSTTVWSRG